MAMNDIGVDIKDINNLFLVVIILISNLIRKIVKIYHMKVLSLLRIHSNA